MSTIKKIIKKIVPDAFFSGYHAFSAYLAATWYGFPGRKLTVVGITGTKGKTSTANLTWAVLSSGGFKTGLLGTANIRIGEKEEANDMHMTMPGPWVTQKLLRKMISGGCTHVVMEVSSEGLKQYRHLGITFAAAVFTNLSPEHLPSHENSFEKYKEAKAELFKTLEQVPTSISVINADSEYGEYYGAFRAGKNFSYGIFHGDIRASDIAETDGTISFSVGIERYSIRLLGRFNVYNALPAIVVGHEFKIPYEKIRAGLTSLAVIPGRMEKIEEGQDFTVVVDYAHEQLSINTLLDCMRPLTTGSIIVLLGAEGGGRDKRKREHLGRASGIKADYVIVSNVDPYEDDPNEIIEGVAVFCEASGKIRGKNLFCIADRAEGIKKAFLLAQKGDIVLITGKGAEMTMVIGGMAKPWDERKIVRDLLKEHINQHDS